MIFKDVLQALIDAEVLKVRSEQKKVTANMTATSPIQFGRNLSPSTNWSGFHPERGLKVINTDPCNEEKGFILVPTRRETMLVYPDIVESQQ